MLPPDPSPEHASTLNLLGRLGYALATQAAHSLPLAIDITLTIDDFVSHLVALFHLLKDLPAFQLTSLGAHLAEPVSHG